MSEQDKTSKHHPPVQFTSQSREPDLLTAERENWLARRWRDHGDVAARDEIIHSYRRLVMKIARKYAKSSKADLNELVQEGNVGLLIALDKFDPDLGFRITTYARWWIKACCLEWAMGNSSAMSVKGTRFRQLWTNMRRSYSKAEAELSSRLGRSPQMFEVRARVSEMTGIPQEQLETYEPVIMGSDLSLNATIGNDEDGSSTSYQDQIPDHSPNPEELAIQANQQEGIKKMIEECLSILSPREAEVLRRRKLSDVESTLEELGVEFAVSKERIRQIEVRAIDKIKRHISMKREFRQLVSEVRSDR